MAPETVDAAPVQVLQSTAHQVACHHKSVQVQILHLDQLLAQQQPNS